MSIIQIILITIALSTSVFSVSLNCSIHKCLSHAERFKISLIFGLFKALMFLAGWKLCSSFVHLIQDYKFWVLSVIFIILGIKMLLGSLRVRPDQIMFDQEKIISLLLISVALSTDAFIIGIGFAFLDVKIIELSVIFVLAAMLFSLAGSFVGKSSGKFLFANVLEFLGALMIIGVGIEYFIKHIIL